MRGLKPHHQVGVAFNPLSHALRVRGLKQLALSTLPATYGSHALRVRGLKPLRRTLRNADMDVARSTRAWIETFLLCTPEKVNTVARSTRAWIETARP